MSPTMKYERELYSAGIRHVAGIDEVGRGPLAGPVVAAAVVLPQGFDLPGVDDSKKLTARKREGLFKAIIGQSLAYGVGMADNHAIDEINILEATKAAMKAAAREAGERLFTATGERVGHLLIDAVSLDGMDVPQTSIIKGDSISVSIAAASIIAKVTRDRLMAECHERHPCYGFDRNKGYGTKEHFEAILLHGTCSMHRMSFLRRRFGDV